MPFINRAQENSKFWGWGDVSHQFDAHAFGRLWKELALQWGDSKELAPIPRIEDYPLPASKLPQSFTDSWKNEGLSFDAFDRVAHSVGKSYKDLVRLREKNINRYPDAVLYLPTEESLPRLFQDAAKHGITLIPFGGGTGVVGGTECVGPTERPIVVVNLRRLNRLLSLDPVAQTATFEAGILGPELEKILNAKGYTLGHFPQSFEFSTLGGWAVTRSAGQNSTKYGKIEKLVASLTVHTPKGVVTTKPFPASAGGPSLLELFVGSEGLYGIATQVTVRISKQPATREFITGFFADFEKGIECMRACVQGGLKPAILRLSDAVETDLFSKMSISSELKKKILNWWLKRKNLGAAPAYLLLGLEGSAAEVAFLKAGLKKQIQAKGGALMGSGQAAKQGKKWELNRFELPYLRDPLMDRRIFIDTLETATTWSRLTELHSAVRKALSSHSVIVGCHVSHAYPDGASLYFTIIGKQQKGSEIPQWEAIKKAASDALVAAGGTISHHHGVGFDHRPWMEAEKGPLGLAILRNIKKDLDPDGLLNPQKLL